MLQTIRASLFRQSKALVVLHELLQEEFALLMKHRPQEVTHLELSIHDLMHQLAVERQGIKDLLSGMRLNDYLEAVVTEDGNDEQDPKEYIRGLVSEIENFEQVCVKQARKNTDVALALMDQNQGLLTWLHDKLVPKSKNNYSRKGDYANKRPDAALINGRL